MIDLNSGLGNIPLDKRVGFKAWIPKRHRIQVPVKIRRAHKLEAGGLGGGTHRGLSGGEVLRGYE